MDAALASDLAVAWNRKLYQWWYHYNEEYLGGGLQAPQISLSRGLQTLGQWDPRHRRLSLSVDHIKAHPWLEVMETLRHEMAHQYVDEVLKARGESPHGPAFKRACQLLRCSPRAQGVPRPGEDEQVLRRLKKVLSLAESPNENEAQAAVKQARRLLLRYNVDMVELDRQRCFAHRTLGPIKGRRASYELWLAAILQDAFFVETLWVGTYDAQRDKNGTQLQVHGTPANLDMAAYVYDYLTGLLEQLWHSYKTQRRLPGNRERQRYWAGVLEGFFAKLNQERQGDAQTALVWRGDPRLQAYYRYLHPRIRTSYSGGVRPTGAYADGLDEGGRVSIRQPVGEGTAGFGGLLSR